LGLVNAVVPAGEEVNTAVAMLQKIAAKAPLAIAGVIASVNAYYQHDEDGFDREVREFGLTAGTEDFREGASAFLEKRKAAFTGR
ncbi:MAG TPA: enoyl-CoA hydratase-related protein, partial [Saprospiraceae bacterium]|nr:enoyl-CoA hydratase-related protein [Saprospiraceae bacterium]